MRPTKIGSALVAMAAVVAVASPARADVTAQATVDRETVGADDTFDVTVAVTGARAAELASLPATRDFQIVGQSRATEVAIRNGGAPETTERLVLTVRPLRTGKLTFPSLALVADGKPVTTTPLAIEVVAGHVGAPARARNDPFAGFGFGGSDPFGDDDDLADLMRRMQSNMGMLSPRPSKGDVLVRASVDNAHPYVGEQATLSIHLLTRVPLSSVQLVRMPSLPGVTADDVPTAKEPTPEIVDLHGVRYQSVLLARKALFPLRGGPIDIPPIEVAADTGGFGGGYRLSASTEPVHLRARELPAGGPTDEAVGRWTLSASVSPAQPLAGEPLTIRIAANGTGDLHALALPAPSLPAGWRSYAPATRDAPRVNGTHVGGTRVVETVVVPDRSGRFVVEIPALPYFDPIRGRHLEARTAPLVVEVAAAAVAATAPSVATPTAPAATQARARRPLQVLPVALATLLPLALVAVAAWLRRRRGLRPTTAAAHLRRARRHLQLAAALRARGRAAQVYEELARALRHAVAAVAPRTAASPARLALHLAEAGVADETRAALVRAADAIDTGRFAPANDDAQEACTLTAAALAAVERTPSRRAAARSSVA